jgi:hypothetical protein
MAVDRRRVADVVGQRRLSALLGAPVTVSAPRAHCGASGRYSSQRYTAGAKALFESGIALRQFTQSAVIFQPES